MMAMAPGDYPYPSVSVFTVILANLPPAAVYPTGLEYVVAVHEDRWTCLSEGIAFIEKAARVVRPWWRPAYIERVPRRLGALREARAAMLRLRRGHSRAQHYANKRRYSRQQIRKAAGL